jgi:hypothetical protein
VLELDPDAEPEELARLLEARGDFATLAEVLEIRAGALEIGDERRDLLLRSAALRAERADDPRGAAAVLLRIREEHGPARDVHALLLPLLEAAESHTELAEVLASELELAEEPERPALLSWLADCFLATERAADALEAFGEVLAVEPSEPQRALVWPEICRTGKVSCACEPPIFCCRLSRRGRRAELVRRSVVADRRRAQEPASRSGRGTRSVEAIGKDKCMLFLAGRGLREAVEVRRRNVPAWLDRIARSENGPSRRSWPDARQRARDRAVDHPPSRAWPSAPARVREAARPVARHRGFPPRARARADNERSSGSTTCWQRRARPMASRSTARRSSAGTTEKKRHLHPPSAP